jgi:hypothetical protein
VWQLGEGGVNARTASLKRCVFAAKSVSSIMRL